MFDIIIPCYNSHNTIDRTLASIVMQTKRDHCKVTLVNDGGKNYTQLIKKYQHVLNIQEIGYKPNKGTASARNYGLLNTSEEFVIFIDSDDCLANPFVIATIEHEMTSDIAVLSCSFAEQLDDVTIKIHSKDVSFMHGKVYRRSFLKKYNLLQNENTRINEDVGFNILLAMITNDKEKYVMLDYVSQYWINNPNSLVRSGNPDFDYNIVFTSFVDNMLFVYSELEKKGIKKDNILDEKTTSMLKIINMYAEKTADHQEYLDSNFAKVKEFYDKVYAPVEDKITEEIFNNAYDSFAIPGNKEENIEAIKYVFKQCRGEIDK